jgi:hypothetical protein
MVIIARQGNAEQMFEAMNTMYAGASRDNFSG